MRQLCRQRMTGQGDAIHRGLVGSVGIVGNGRAAKGWWPPEARGEGRQREAWGARDSADGRPSPEIRLLASGAEALNAAASFFEQRLGGRVRDAEVRAEAEGRAVHHRDAFAFEE